MSDVDDVRDRLQEERQQTAQRVTGLIEDLGAVVASSRDTNADDEHDPEGATIAFERSQIDSLLRQAKRHLDEIEAAIARLEAGTYGRCEACGEPIARGRLEARAVARTCVRCAASTRG